MFTPLWGRKNCELLYNPHIRFHVLSYFMCHQIYETSGSLSHLVEVRSSYPQLRCRCRGKHISGPHDGYGEGTPHTSPIPSPFPLYGYTYICPLSSCAPPPVLDCVLVSAPLTWPCHPDLCITPSLPTCTEPLGPLVQPSQRPHVEVSVGTPQRGESSQSLLAHPLPGGVTPQDPEFLEGGTCVLFTFV